MEESKQVKQAFPKSACHSGEKLREKLSIPQFLILFWGSLLSPLAESLLPLPQNLAFLAPLFLCPVLLLWGNIYQEFFRDKEGNPQGFAEKICSFSGKQERLGLISKGILLLYLFWGILLLAYQLRLCGLSFLSVGYQEGSLYFILPALACLILWMGGSSLGGFARASTLYFAIVLLLFAVVLGFSLPMAQPQRVFPLWKEDMVDLNQTVLPLLGLFGYGFYCSFFWGEVVQETKSPETQRKTLSNTGKHWCTWAIWGCGLCSLMIFMVTAVFGTVLQAQLDKPFFVLAKSISLEGGFQRVESVVLSLWTLGDFILLGVLLRGTTQCGKKLLRWEYSPLIMTGIVVTALIISLFVTEILEEQVIFTGNFLLAWLFPCILYLCSSLGKQNHHK